jgi:putative transposase
MQKDSTATPEASLFDGSTWFDPIEAGIRDRMRGFIEVMLEEELTAAVGRARYRRAARVTVDIGTEGAVQRFLEVCGCPQARTGK